MPKKSKEGDENRNIIKCGFLVNSTPGNPTEERVERWISRRSGCHLPATRPFALGGPQSLGEPVTHY
jgi:hypothetical protein